MNKGSDKLGLWITIKIWFRDLNDVVSPKARKRVLWLNIKATILLILLYPLYIIMAILSYILLSLFAILSRSMTPLTESELAWEMRNALNLKDILKHLWSSYRFRFKCKKCKKNKIYLSII